VPSPFLSSAAPIADHLSRRRRDQATMAFASSEPGKALWCRSRRFCDSRVRGCWPARGFTAAKVPYAAPNLRLHSGAVRVAAPNAGGRPRKGAGIAARAGGAQTLREEALELLVQVLARRCVSGRRSRGTCDARAHVAELLAVHHGVLRIADVHAGGGVHARRTQAAVLAGAVLHDTSIVRIGATALAPGRWCGSPHGEDVPRVRRPTAQQVTSCSAFLDTGRMAGDTRGVPKEGPTT
jgi:hypothetical protein